jgi:hypothetical protein
VEGRRGRGTIDPGCRHCLLRGPRDQGNEPGRGSFRARGGDGVRELHCTLDARARASLAADGGDLLLALRGLVLLLLSSPYLIGLEWGSVGGGAWAAVAFSAVLATAFSFSAWQTGVSRIGANRVLVYQYLITVTGVASGIVFSDEVLGTEKLVGGAVILVGLYLARRQ